MPLTTVQSGMMDDIAQYNGFKNRIINGAMQIDQRNAGASITPINTQFLVDRFAYNATQASKFTAQQNQGSVIPPAGFSNYQGLTVSSAVSIGAGDFFGISQNIEGFNIADLAWGTANAQTVTLSFWVRSSLTGTFGGSLRNSGSSRSYPFSYTINSANTWEKETITIAGDTSGTWLTNNGIGINLFLSLGSGSTYLGTAGAWAGSALLSTTGATSVVGTNGATFYITGVQLEKGVTATSFDYRPYGTEFALCQRYYQLFSGFTIEGYSASGLQRAVTVPMSLPVTMRVNPTRTVISNGTYTNIRGSSNSYAGFCQTLNTTYVTAAIESAAAGYTQCTGQTESLSAEL
jgi:hypothetical protein